MNIEPKPLKYLICILFIVINYQCIAQNLVINGGFEIGDKSRFIDYVKDSGYFKIGTGSQLSLSDAEIYGQARGRKSAGCFTSRNDKYFLYGSLLLTLTKKLEKNKWYEISYFAKHGYGLYASNNIGIALSSKESIRNYHILPAKNVQIVNALTGKNILKNQEWEIYTLLYKSNGTEDVVLLGNMFYNAPMVFEAIENPKERYKDNLCLYFFDDVKIVPFNQSLSIYFDENSSSLTESSKITLDDLIRYLQLHNFKKIVLSGYADMTGIISNNNTLSLKRTEEVKAYFNNKSSTPLDIQLKSFGSTNKFDNNKLQFNRVVKIEITQ